jgi:N-acetylneuraminic acid mutarotase
MKIILSFLFVAILPLAPGTSRYIDKKIAVHLHDYPALSTPRLDHEIAINGNKILILGGASFLAGRFTLCENDEMLDLRKNEWKLIPGLQIPRCSFEAVVIKNNIFIIGGRDKENKVLNSVEKYNIITGERTTMAPMNIRRDKHAAVSLGNRIFVMGGRESEDQYTLEEYDVEMDAWKILEVSKRPRNPIGGVTDGKYIYWISDTVSASMTDHKILEQYDTANHQWKMLNDMPTPRCDTPVILYENKIIIPDGWTVSGNTNMVEAYDLTENKWKIL